MGVLLDQGSGKGSLIKTGKCKGKKKTGGVDVSVGLLQKSAD